MILADKIINERKKLGWSQEELAEKLGVSRQSVSKWEGAQAVPELQKILIMSEIFGVSTDYLLKDEIEELSSEDIKPSVDYDTVPVKRKVSLEEATEYIAATKATAPANALAAMLFVLCPVTLIFLAGFSNKPGSGISENMAAGIGLLALFVLIAIGVTVTMIAGGKTKKYTYIKEEDIETEYGVIGMVKEQKASFETTHNTYKIIGVILCLCSPIALVVGALAEIEDYLIVATVCLLLVMIAAAVYLFVLSGNVWEAYQALLKEGEYSAKNKKANKKMAPYVRCYWLIATAIFLLLGFLTAASWSRAWIVWPITGVLFAPFHAFLKAVLKID
ncbi:MAG: helix-turn-helix domain-containing protein [Lachnospiraceae bacterium]|nr:helix-turn-helix domain-containing protein [Lachnospiraceae bacterium]